MTEPNVEPAEPALPLPVRCREIGPQDYAGIVALLARGFPHHPESHWRVVFDRLAAHATPAGLPRYGFLLERGGAIVGSLFVIFTEVETAGTTILRGNIASWYVDPQVRGYAAMLSSRALSYKKATYLNITPARNTWPILDAQGYRVYCTHRFIAVGLLSRHGWGARVRRVVGRVEAGGGLTEGEARVLSDHAAYGLISLLVEADGRRIPLVFMRRLRYGWVPYAEMAFCRSVDEFVSVSGAVGRYLASVGLLFLFIDAPGALAGIFGRYADAGRKYFKGPVEPRLGDLAYTEWTMFGV